MAADDTTWTDTVISNLRRLWDEGHATAEIGRRLGVTKNAVIGKAHRLELPRRPSPIQQNSQTARKPGPRPKVVSSRAVAASRPCPDGPGTSAGTAAHPGRAIQEGRVAAVLLAARRAWQVPGSDSAMPPRTRASRTAPSIGRSPM